MNCLTVILVAKTCAHFTMKGILLKNIKLFMTKNTHSLNVHEKVIRKYKFNTMSR